MIATARQKSKFRGLVRRLRSALPNLPVDIETIAVGLLERLWHAAANDAPRGDIGKMSDDDIAESIGWFGEAAVIVQILTETGWLDVDKQYRLLVHDWHEHAPNYVKGNVAKMGGFLTIQSTEVVEVGPASKAVPQPYSGRAPEAQPIGPASRDGTTKPNQTKPNLTNSNQVRVRASHSPPTPTGVDEPDAPTGPIIPEPLRECWDRWAGFVLERHGYSIGAIAAETELMRLSGLGPDKAARDIDFSIRKGAKSILDSDNDYEKRASRKPPPIADSRNDQPVASVSKRGSLC